MYLVFSAITSRLIPLLVTNKAYVLLLIVSLLPATKLT
jgi:hypothetical protein